MGVKSYAGTEMPKALLKGTVIVVGTTIAGAALMSMLIIREILREQSIGYCAMAVLVISSYVAAAAAMRCAKRKAAMTSALSGLIYYGVLLITNALCFKGGYEGIGVTGLLIMGGSVSALLMELRKQNGRKNRPRKNRRR